MKKHLKFCAKYFEILREIFRNFTRNISKYFEKTYTYNFRNLNETYEIFRKYFENFRWISSISGS
jgi:hypothetical protein